MPNAAYYHSQHWRALRAEAIRRAGGCCSVPGCGSTYRLTADHYPMTRPCDATGPTSADTLANLRVLCGNHDAQVKELASGKRRRDGKPTVRGCRPDGTPLDPSHPWLRPVLP